MRIHAALMVLLFSTGPLITETRATDDSVAHGTINVVLGNENGIVILIDSMITLDNHWQSPDPAQKLFKLDDRTVCTFAGFAAAPGPGDFFYTSASAIIREFSRQLSLTSQPLSLDEKLQALSYIFARQLTALANLRDAAKQVTDPSAYLVQLTVAGYDIDVHRKSAR
jgi:20S proteasome alpha/beta subunit